MFDKTDDTMGDMLRRGDEKIDRLLIRAERVKALYDATGNSQRELLEALKALSSAIAAEIRVEAESMTRALQERGREAGRG